MKRLVISSIVLIFVLLGILIVPQMIVGDTPLVRLKSAAPLVGVIAQAIGPDNRNHMPIAGRDFNILDVQYFDTGDWAVVSMNTSKVSDKALVVLHKIPDYSVVLGPGTSFPHNAVADYPADVVQYLESQGGVYVSS